MIFYQVSFSTPEGGTFYFYKGAPHFFSLYKSIIYQIEREGLLPKYAFDVGERAFDEGYLNEKGKLKRYEEKGDYYKIGSVLENDEFLVFSLFNNLFPISYTGYYSKETGNVICSPFFALGKNSYLSGYNIATYNSWIIAKLQVDNLLSWDEFTDKNKILLENEFLRDRKNLTKELTLDDNPVLMFYKLKSF